jgi:regulator of sigma E protease
MPDLVANLSTVFDLLLVILGFGAIVFVHELGHFLAARWAKIRVLAFALGFGPAIFSYRKGLGFRRGSSERDVRWTPELGARGISSTEYRFNALPFGGYVKMLGQDDLDPTAVSNAKDSYQNAPVGKRMVVISAGVIMNMVTAAILFMFVFMVGLKTEPPIIGDVLTGVPASMAKPNTPAAPVGLQPGDQLLTINGRTANTFNDLLLATGMSGPNDTVEVTLARTPEGGSPQTLSYSIKPEISRQSGLFDIGVLPSRSATILNVKRASERAQFDDVVEQLGLPGLEPGSTLVRVNADRSPMGPSTVRKEAAKLETAQPIELEFKSPTGETRVYSLAPKPGLMDDLATIKPGHVVPIEHVLGLAPVMTVADASPELKGYEKGLRTGDIFARVGALEFPRQDQGMREIDSNRNGEVHIVVLRESDSGTPERVDLGKIRVDKAGTIGFYPGTTARDSTLLAKTPESLLGSAGDTYSPATASLAIVPGSRITSFNGEPVASLGELAVKVRERARQSPNGMMEPFEIRVADPAGVEVTLTISPTAAETARARQLVWQPPLGAMLFAPTEFKLKATGPLGAVGMGLSETRRVMLMTYMTFVRLFQGTVKVEHLKGPVGIAHMGTLLADRGIVWLLFFLALVSVNLAVINFLPLPIVDGGQMVFLLFEWARGKPVPVQIQNVVTLGGLLCVVAMFLLVTFNDVRNLLGL